MNAHELINGHRHTRLRHVWEHLRTSFWFVPTVMTVIAIGLAFLTVWLDRRFGSEALEGASLVYLGGTEGARLLLSTLASSVITVAGVVFSITIATLTQASSQFGPRLLRNFMGDRGNQLVLGTFVATFMYCLMVLRTVWGEEERAFVPHISVTAAVLMALASLGVLIYFIHHVSLSLQAPVVVANVSRDLDAIIERTFPDEAVQPGAASAACDVETLLPEGFAGDAVDVRAIGAGYVQALDEAQLTQLARRRDVVIRMTVRPGDFVTGDEQLALVWPGARVDRELKRELNSAVLMGTSRTNEQDIEFAIDQMVEIAVRAISPAINDPFTAIHCIDWIGQGLGKIARRPLPSPCRWDEDGRLRLVLRLTDFGGITDAAFDQVRQYGRDSVAITTRLLETITTIGRSVENPAYRRELLRHATMIRNQGVRHLTEDHDVRSVERRYDLARRALEAEDLADERVSRSRDPSLRSG